MPTQKNSIGFTLIEVLIALAVISIALTAIIKTTTQNIQSTAYLQKKTLALWVGQTVMNEARIGVRKLASGMDKAKETTAILGQDFYWQAEQAATPNKRIKKITIQVFANDREETPLVSLESYVYVAS